MKRFAFFTLLLLAALPFSQARAQVNDLKDKNSIDYLMDDGKMTPDEMFQEAEYIHNLCLSNEYQRTYFDCQCLGGAFLQRREKAGPYMPQNMLVDQIVRGTSTACANTAVIAGTTYDSCMGYSATYREFEKDNEDYCSCVANYTANAFTKRPFLSTGYIEGMKSYAMNMCEDPNKRPRKSEAQNANAWPSGPRTLN